MLKNQFKDRYTIAFFLLIIGLGLVVYFLRIDNGILAVISLFLGISYFPFLFNTGGNVHFQNSNHIALHQLKIKKERVHRFEQARPKHLYKNKILDLDGIRNKNGLPYKLVNGSDILATYRNGKYFFTPLGIGSYFLQIIGGGGLNPTSIRHRRSWR